MSDMTTIKVAVGDRDALKSIAAESGVTLGDALRALIREHERSRLIRELNEWEPDEEYLAEREEWDRADLGTAAG
ncbi:hypothetical protein [Agromyces archimandritae]|uniref:Uncharacterized protein n=1 Tax=Agromyces archimandritae TaxID=2781962 RepID=A0A975FPT6_9MICO|nr:hypothetical protein [Agromyces archimandritae]QTX05789.1 hypothetical protein G127AT_06185 [Agromyces archimandritae]